MIFVLKKTLLNSTFNKEKLTKPNITKLLKNVNHIF